MFGLGIRYLMGWAMAAADGAKKEVAEWPPHPDRVFMALAAAWFETGKDETEGDALHWLEQLSAPDLSASQANFRSSGTQYVPVNDESDPAKWDSQKKRWQVRQAIGDLPIGRNRQPRGFPVAVPDDPSVYFIWEQVIPSHLVAALATLCTKVGAIGHSASLVQMWLTMEPPIPTLVPTMGIATVRLRVFGAGRLAYLERRQNRAAWIEFHDRQAAINAASREQRDRRTSAHSRRLSGADAVQARVTAAEQARDNPGRVRDSGAHVSLKELKARQAERFPLGAPISLRPESSLWQGYAPQPREVRPTTAGSLFDQRLLVLALHGKRLALPTTLKLTQALRGTLLAACQEPIPEWLSGHDSSGGPSRNPHIACLPLPFVDAPHADGRILGLAIALPRDLDPAEAAETLEPWLRDENGLPRTLKLFAGRSFETRAELETRESRPHSLRAEIWTAPSRWWASVTPIVFDRHFKGSDKWDNAAETVKDACERIGLPRPGFVELHPVSTHRGVPRSAEFPYLSRKADGGRMHHAHAFLEFAEPVAGPILIGAGRFRGYGLCRPVQRGKTPETRGIGNE